MCKILMPEVSPKSKHLPVWEAVRTPWDGALRKTPHFQMTSTFCFKLSGFFKSLLKTRKIPMSKAFWQHQNSSVFLLCFAKKSDFAVSFWPIPLTTSPHGPLFPQCSTKLLELTSKRLSNQQESDILILPKSPFPCTVW